MSSMVLDGGMPRSRSTDPVTSLEAGRAANLSKSQAAVLELMRRGGDWTQGELESRFSGQWSPSRIRSAVSELESRGLVEWAQKMRPTMYGRRAQVYRAVASG